MFTTAAFDRRLAAFERAEQDRFGRLPRGGDLARVSLARRLASRVSMAEREPAAVSRGPAFLLRS